ncbi:hypothetical protein B0H19DRAFT_1105113 [Mycena capillaripes]|nr:hypothetical protein B0H19DRAFT_1105113 [Mycena capillaripes]
MRSIQRPIQPSTLRPPSLAITLARIPTDSAPSSMQPGPALLLPPPFHRASSVLTCSMPPHPRFCHAHRLHCAPTPAPHSLPLPRSSAPMPLSLGSLLVYSIPLRPLSSKICSPHSLPQSTS